MRHSVFALLLSLPLLTACPDPGTDPTPTPTPAPTPTATADALPGPVTDFTATPNGQTIDLAWTNPGDADLAGILVVGAMGQAVVFLPSNGTLHAQGDDLGNGERAVTVDLLTAFSGPVVPLGVELHFAAWAVDAAGQYSEVAATASAIRTELGSQTATITIDVAGGAATVTQQPENFTLDTVGVAVDTVAQTVDFAVGVQNDGGRLIFNLKGVTDSQGAGAQTAPTFWVENDKPYTYFGPEALAPGARVERAMSFTGIDGTVDPVLVELHFVEAPMFFGGNYGGDFVGIDTSMSGETFNLPFSDGTLGEQMRQAVITLDGRYIYGAEKATPRVNIIDTTTLEVSGGVHLGTAANGLGAVGGVALSPDGSKLYASFNDGAHWHGRFESGTEAPTTADLIELDAVSLAELQRLSLFVDDADSMSVRSVAISPDGATLAIAASGMVNDRKELWFVNLLSFTVIDTDGSTTDVDPVALTSPGAAETVYWSEDGSTVIVGSNSNKGGLSGEVTVDLVDPSTYTVTSVLPGTGADSLGVLAVHGGKVYCAARNNANLAFGIVDMATGTATNPDVNGLSDATGVVFEPSGERYWVVNYNDAQPMDALTDTPIDADGDTGNGVTGIYMTEQARAHFMVVSPF